MKNKLKVFAPFDGQLISELELNKSRLMNAFGFWKKPPIWWKREWRNLPGRRHKKEENP